MPQKFMPGHDARESAIHDLYGMRVVGNVTGILGEYFMPTFHDILELHVFCGS